MYSLACINLSSEAHTQMPSVRHSIRFSRCRGASPLARASLRRKKELYQHPALRVKENFEEIFRPVRGRPRALRLLAPRSRPASRAFAAGASHYTSPRRFVKGVICKKEGDPEGFPSLTTIGGCDLTQRLLSAEHRTRKYRQQAWLARLPRA